MSALPLKADMLSVSIDVVKCHKRTPRQIDKGLTAWSSTADSFEDEAVDDAANRALLCEVGTDQAVRGLAP